MAEQLNVVFQFNEDYVPFVGASMVSLFLNNADLEEICVYALCEQVSEESKAKLRATAADYNRTLRLLDTEQLVQKITAVGIPCYRGSYATNFKMFLPELVPDTLERVLYIDADTIVQGSLRPLLNFPMEGHPVAMAYDSLGKNHALQIGLDAAAGYYNAGVILFDMRAWREQRCTEKIIHHVQEIRAHYMAPDQDLLNVVLCGNIALLPAEYDYQPVHLVTSVRQYRRLFRPAVYYTDKELHEAAKAPVIYHFFRFLGEFPWHSGTQHPCRKIFDKYLALSRWADYERTPSRQNGFVFQTERTMYRLLPRNLFMPVFKLSYDLFIWKCRKDSDKGVNNKRM